MASAEHHFIPYSAVDCVRHGRVLVFAPHPDDEVLGCGGAIIRHIQAGDPVNVIVVTAGAYGAPDATGAYALTRQQESIAAANVLGYGAPCFWGLPDRSLEYGEFLIQRILGAINEYQPDIVYAPSWWEIHPDHVALAMAAAEAVRRSLPPLQLAMYEVGVPLHPNTLLDITAIVDRKHAALACFPSQLAQQRYDEHIAGLNRFRTYTLPAAVTAAEAYRVVSQGELKGDPVRMIRPGIYYGQSARAQDAALPLVSVIVRSLGRPQIADALDAIGLQTYSNIEILVVNAPGHSHSDVASWYGRFPTRVFPAEPGIPQGRAVNVALDDARGEYLVVLDSVQVVCPDHISALVHALQLSHEIHAAYSGVRVDSIVRGEIVGSEEHNQPFQRQKLCIRNYIPLSAVIFETSLVQKGCRFDDTLSGLQDWDFLLQLVRHTDLLHVDLVTVISRKHCGAHLHTADPADCFRQSAAALLDKWKGIWSGRQFAEIVCYIDDALEQSDHRYVALQHRVAELEAGLRHEAQLSHELLTRNAEL